MLARYQLPRGASMASAIVARRALSPSTPRAQGAPLRASGGDRSARPSKWLSCQQCEKAPLGLTGSIFNRHPPEVSITEICYQFRVSHMGCSPVLSPMSRAAQSLAYRRFDRVVWQRGHDPEALESFTRDRNSHLLGTYPSRHFGCYF